MTEEDETRLQKIASYLTYNTKGRNLSTWVDFLAAWALQLSKIMLPFVIIIFVVLAIA